MDPEDRSDIEPGASEPVGGPPAEPKARQSFRRLHRELTDEELASAGVQKMLLDEIERLERDLSEERNYRQMHHLLAVRVATLEAKGKRNLGAEIISMACLAIGAAAVGYSPALEWAKGGWMSLAFGIVLILAGIIARWVQG